MKPLVVHVVPSVTPRTGGTAESVPRLCHALNAASWEARIVTLAHGEVGPACAGVGLVQVALSPMAQRLRGFTPHVADAYRTTIRTMKPHVVHNHGLWMGPNVWAHRASMELGVPFVVSPRGMLEPWARSHGGWYKKMAWALYQRRAIESADLLHATSPMERDSLRALGLRAPVAVIPNGVTIPDIGSIPGREVLEQCHPILAGRRWLLFLSRLHAKKGIDLLLEAWSRIAAGAPGWALVIAGEGRRDERARYESRARGLPSVVFTGHLDGVARSVALRHADVFVLPSFSENFGIAIAEALAHGTPVITTTGTPWAELRERECGWCIAPELQALEESLRTALLADKEVLDGLGQRGRNWMIESFDWRTVGVQMAAAYDWLRGGHAKPDWIDSP